MNLGLTAALVSPADLVWPGPATLANRPHPLSLYARAWEDARVAQLIAATDVARTNTRYIDFTGGNDSNDGLTPATAWKNLSKVVAALANDTAYLFKRGETWRSTVGVNSAAARTGVTFDAYGTGDLPVFTTATLYPNTGWTSVSGDVFKRTEAGTVAAVFEQGDVHSPYWMVTSTAECQARPGSWYTSGGELFVHLRGSLSPATSAVRIEAYPQNATNGIFFPTGSSGIVIKNMKVLGYGADRAAQQPFYSIKGDLTGQSVIVTIGCIAAVNGRHNIGNTGAAGGIIVTKDCVMGWCVGIDSPWVTYSVASGNEGYCVNCTFLGGAPPVGVPPQNFGATVPACYGHTSGGANLIGYYLVKGCRILPGPWQCSDWSGPADTPNFETDVTLCRAVIRDCYFQAGPPTKFETERLTGSQWIGRCPTTIRQTGVTGRTCLYDSNVWEIVAKWTGTDPGFGRAFVDRIEGYHVNSMFLLDTSFINSAATGAWAFGLAPYKGNIHATFNHCHFDVKGSGVANFGFVGDLVRLGNNNDNPPDLFMYNNVWHYQANPLGTRYLGAGNNRNDAGAVYSPARISGLVHNAPGTGTWLGTDGVAGTVLFRDWYPYSVPSGTEIDSAPVPLPGGYRIETDMLGRPRRADATSMGPIERRAR